MKNGSAVLLALLVAGTLGQRKYCCAPTQWESVNELSDARVASGTKTPVLTEGVEQVSVDGISRKIASLSTLNSGGFRVNVQIIQLYDQGIMYTIQSGECKTTTLPPWTPRCIPDEATLMTKTYFGVGGTKVDVDVYSLVSGPNTIFLDIAHEDCTPITQSAYGSAGGVSAISVKIYGNVTLGIKDHTVFNVPDICKNATQTPEVHSAFSHNWF